MINYGMIVPGSAVTLLARVVDASGNPLTIEGTSTISVTITDMMLDTAGSPITVPVSSSVFDSYQQTPAWTTDAIGFNLAIALPGSNFPASQTTYQAVVTITPVARNPLKVVWQLQTNDVI